MIQFNPQVSSVFPKPSIGAAGPAAQKPAGENSPFAKTVKAVEGQLNKVDQLQKASDTSIQELLSGKNEDITSVVSTVAKADMSFKLLVGVRNKLVEAYKETMNMPL